MPTSWPKERRLIGTRVPRVDGPDKATGHARYSFDINRPGLLHAMILRCPLAHAQVESIDTAAAEKMPGVKAIHIIAAPTEGPVARVDAANNKVILKLKQGEKDVERTVDVPPPMKVQVAGKEVKLADLKPGDMVSIGRELYYAGDEVVALAADTEEHAKDALRAIQVKYQPLDFFVREEDALKNPTKKTVGGAIASNVTLGGEANKGNVDDAFKQADAVVEGQYGVPVICHQCLESHGLVAEWDEKKEKLTVWASTQAVTGTAQQLAVFFKIPPTNVTCLTEYMGGGFGSKFGPDIQGITAAELARKASTVKLMLDRAEEVTVGGNRPSAYGTVKIAGKKDGSITAYAVDCHGSPGHAGGATVNLNLLPYVYMDAIPNWKRKHTVVRLNGGSARAMRAPGHPQNCVLTECPIDDLAAALGLDPLQMRLKNLPPNDPAAAKKDPLGWLGMRNTVYTKEIEIAAGLAKWKEKWHPPGKGPGTGPMKHGIGMGLHTWGGGAQGGNPPPNECTVIISRDGSVTAQTSTQDLGTAQRTITALVTAEILGLKVTDVVTRLGDNHYGRSTGSGGSTTCPAQAPATLRAAQAARDELFAKVAEKLGAKKEDLAIEVVKGAPRVVDTASKKSWEWKEACARLGMDQAIGKGAWSGDPDTLTANPGVSNAQVGGVQIAEVVVDTETGVVRCTHVVGVQDVGLVVNLQGCESQMTGGIIMGVNYALFEDRIMDATTGRQVNPDMEFYKLGGIQDMPKITVHMHNMPERGVIGIGEPATISTCAAIGNAVFNAIGVRVPFAPYTPERVLAALEKKGGKA